MSSAKSPDSNTESVESNPFNGMRLFGKPRAGKSGVRRGVRLTPRIKGSGLSKKSTRPV